MDQDAKKRLLRKLTYGLYVLAAKDGEDMGAATVSWISQSSFDPPKVMVAIRVDSHINQLVARSRAFAVSLIGEHQKEMASTFFRPTRVEEGSMSGHAIEAGPETGSPVFTEAPGWFEARVTDEVEGGDHTIFVAEVVSVRLAAPEARPLKLADTEWTYGG
jgi:flavin reductase (DIM6/NTAB) family NADH-FMN oxidoreductase RutF